MKMNDGGVGGDVTCDRAGADCGGGEAYRGPAAGGRHRTSASRAIDLDVGASDGGPRPPSWWWLGREQHGQSRTNSDLAVGVVLYMVWPPPPMERLLRFACRRGQALTRHAGLCCYKRCLLFIPVIAAVQLYS
jgi:hypothetical protein